MPTPLCVLFYAYRSVVLRYIFLLLIKNFFIEEFAKKMDVYIRLIIDIYIQINYI